MIFIGQEQIWKELIPIIQEMKEGHNFNILLRAPSGCGKTKLAISIANMVDENNVELIIPDMSGNIILSNYRIIIIDEIHTLRQPEILYPVMDSGNHSFILCSNEYGELKEPLTNRCFDFIFVPYTINEIVEIIDRDLLTNNIDLSEECLYELAENCGGTPRIARQITARLVILFKYIKIPETPEEMREILREHFQLENGLNSLHKRYLEFLEKVKKASLDSISFATRIDKTTIRKEIEPVLLSKLLIKITSRGREYASTSEF